LLSNHCFDGTIDHVPCAANSANSIDPNTGKPTYSWVWCYIALAIADNHHQDACFFVEDGGFFSDTMNYEKLQHIFK